MKLLLDNGDEHVGADGAPDLRLYRVLTGTQEFLDSQVLFDPLEEQLDLPAVLVQRSDSQRRQRRVVGQEDQVLARLGVLETDAPQVLGIVLGNVIAIHGDQLIADDSTGAVRGSGIHPPRIHIAFGPRDKEGASLMHLVESGEIDIATIHHVKGACLDGQDVENVDVVHLAVADMDESRNSTAQIQQRMHLHRRFGRAKWRPVEQGKAQVDSRGVQCVDGRIQTDVQRIAGIEVSGAQDQAHRQCMVDAPVAKVQCVRQCGARWHAPHAHVKQLALIGCQAHLDVAQGLAPGQLCECHHAKEVGTSQGAYTRVAMMALDDSAKRLPRHKLHDLCK